MIEREAMVEDSHMDYFYWDEIFGGRQGLTQSLFDEIEEEEAEPMPDLVSVVIVWADDAQLPQGR